jgi:hypothetical protein
MGELLPRWYEPQHHAPTNCSKFIAFGMSFAIDFGTSKGLGRHDIDIPRGWLSRLRQSEYAFTILYVSLVGFDCLFGC